MHHVVVPGLVNVYILPWKITIFNGKKHYFNGHFQLLFVCSPEGMTLFARPSIANLQHRKNTAPNSQSYPLSGLFSIGCPKTEQSIH